MTPPWLLEAEDWKTRVLDRLNTLPPKEQQRAPGPHTWSPAQVVEHLILVEERLVTDWRTAALAFPGMKPGVRGAVMLWFATRGLKSLFRIPTVAGLEPGGSADADTLSARWAAVRGQIPGTFPTDASGLWIIHPIFGPVSMERMGPFLVVHLQHHWKHWPGNFQTR